MCPTEEVDVVPTPKMAVPSLAPQPTWRALAQCRCDDAVHFYAPSSGETREQRREREDAAKALCRRCPVQAQCLSYALQVQEPHGIWGGLDEVERRRVLRRRAAQAASPGVSVPAARRPEPDA